MNLKNNKKSNNNTDNNDLVYSNQSNESSSLNISYPLWLSVSESAKLGGVTSKTIRRAIQSNKIKFKIIKNRYLIDFSSAIYYLSSNKKLKNKLDYYGIGQYIEKWKK